MHGKVRNGARGKASARAREVKRQEVRERAALLLRLGRTREEAVARCRQNLRWDYALHGEPELLGEVEKIVSDVYRRTLSLDPTR
jgi:hypothetical protein